MSITQIDSAANEITAILAHLPPPDALAALHRAMGRVLAKIATDPPPRRFLRGRAQPFKIDQDPELKAFVLGLPGPVTIAALRAEMIARFGHHRTPSKSAIHRYLKSLEGR